jgi:hypothetical protein
MSLDPGRKKITVLPTNADDVTTDVVDEPHGHYDHTGQGGIWHSYNEGMPNQAQLSADVAQDQANTGHLDLAAQQRANNARRGSGYVYDFSKSSPSTADDGQPDRTQ